MNYWIYKRLRRLATRCPWWLARRVYHVAFTCLERHNETLPPIA